MDEIDRAIINGLQGGFPVCERPYAQAAAALGLGEDQLLARISALLGAGVLTRFGPMYNIDRMGGAFSLCAMAVPPARLDQVAEQVNRHPEVAHNYERDHAFNLWFVVATERPEGLAPVLTAIEHETGLPVYDMPKIEEFYIGMRLQA